MAERTSRLGMNSNSHRSSWRIRAPLKFLGRLKHRFKTGFSWERFFREHDPADFTEPDAASNYAPPFPVQAAPLHWPYSYCSSTPAAAAGLHDHEASGSNPPSEYFDALDRPEYVAQQQIDNYSQLNRPSFLEVDTRYTYYTPQEISEQGPQWSGYNTGTPALPVDTDPAKEIYYSGELFPDATTETNFSQYSTDVDATSNSQHANASSISLTTGDTTESGEATIDTSASSSSYVLPPVPVTEEHHSMAQYILDVGRFLIGSDYRYQWFPKPRGRGVRALARIVCAFQAGKRLLNMIRVKKRRATCHLSARLIKKIKATRSPDRRAVPRSGPEPETPTDSGSGSKPGMEFRGVKMRNGKWVVEKRVSMAGKLKVWLGTFNSATEAALAYDAAVFHCAEKKKQVENLNFPELRTHLEPSRYSEVLTLCRAGSEKLEEAKTLVKSLAAAHAALASIVR